MSKLNFSIFRLIKAFWNTSISKELEYRLNLFIEIISVIGNLSGSLFVLSIFYKGGFNLGGWTWSESVVVLAIYTILDGLTTSILQPNLSRIVQQVQDGTLDFVLIKPVNSQIWLSLRVISPWGIPSIISGFLLITYTFIIGKKILSLYSILLFCLTLISSIFILYSLWFIIATTSIWFVRIWNANEVLRSVLVAGRYPISAFPAGLRFVFTFLLPITFLTSVPAEAILGKISLSLIIFSLLFSLALLFLSNKFWNFAISFYTSASS